MAKLAGLYDLVSGIIALILGILLVIVADWYGIIVIIAGAWLLYRGTKKRKAAKAAPTQ